MRNFVLIDKIFLIDIIFNHQFSQYIAFQDYPRDVNKEIFLNLIN